jgi:hypothetical protein
MQKNTRARPKTQHAAHIVAEVLIMTQQRGES